MERMSGILSPGGKAMLFQSHPSAKPKQPQIALFLLQQSTVTNPDR